MVTVVSYLSQVLGMCGYVGVWVCGCVGVLVRECMGVWVCTGMWWGGDMKDEVSSVTVVGYL